jgi:hypothetical protein
MGASFGWQLKTSRRPTSPVSADPNCLRPNRNLVATLRANSNSYLVSASYSATQEIVHKSVPGVCPLTPRIGFRRANLVKTAKGNESYNSIRAGAGGNGRSSMFIAMNRFRVKKGSEGHLKNCGWDGIRISILFRASWSFICSRGRRRKTIPSIPRIPCGRASGPLRRGPNRKHSEPRTRVPVTRQLGRSI